MKKMSAFVVMFFCALLFTSVAQANTLSGATLRLAQAMEKKVAATTYILSEIGQDGYVVDLVSWRPGQNDPPKLIPGHTYQVRGEKRDTENELLFQAFSDRFTAETPSVTISFSLSADNYPLEGLTVYGVPNVNPGDYIYGWFRGPNGGWSGYAYGSVDDTGKIVFYTGAVPLNAVADIDVMTIYRSTGNGQEFLGATKVSGQSLANAIINGGSVDLQYAVVDEGVSNAVYSERYEHDSMLFQGITDVFDSAYQVRHYEVTLEGGKIYSFITSPPSDGKTTPARQCYLRILQDNNWFISETGYTSLYVNNAWRYFPEITGWTCPATGKYTIVVEEARGESNGGYYLKVAEIEGGAYVELSPNTPPSETITAGTTTEFIRFVVTAPPDKAITIKGFGIAGHGMFVQNDLENLYINDATTGTTISGYVADISAGDVDITDITILPGDSREFVINATVSATCYSGHTVGIDVTSVDAENTATGNPIDVSGTRLQGNTMTLHQ